jgi:vacuolar-type H+-ATPase subunit H
MKLKIEKEFVDKFTNVTYKANEEIEFAEERANELLADARNLVSKAAEAIVEPVTHAVEDVEEHIEKPKRGRKGK